MHVLKEMNTEREPEFVRDALCSDGKVYPLFYDNWYGVCLLCDALVCADRYELEGGEVVYSPEGGKPDEQK